MLNVQGLDAYYGKSHVLHDVSFSVGDGEIVGLLGRNGAGKTTMLRSIMGLVVCNGVITWSGQDVMRKRTHEITRLGIAYVPEDRRVFSQLSVEENLSVAEVPGVWNATKIFELFPSLAARKGLRARSLSGGEQQMLAIGRALMTNPRLLLLDEPSQGLAPVIVDALVETLHELRAGGLGILLVEQAIDVAERLADRDYVLEGGAIVHSGETGDASASRAIRERYLSV